MARRTGRPSEVIVVVMWLAGRSPAAAQTVSDRLWWHRLYLLPVSFTDNIDRRPSPPAPGHVPAVEQPDKNLGANFQVSGSTPSRTTSIATT